MVCLCSPLLLGSLVPSVTHTMTWGQVHGRRGVRVPEVGLGWLPVPVKDSEAFEQVGPQSKVGGSGLSHRRLGCCCEGYAWVSPRRRSLEFCVYW